jgi:hypothetical protein
MTLRDHNSKLLGSERLERVAAEDGVRLKVRVSSKVKGPLYRIFINQQEAHAKCVGTVRERTAARNRWASKAILKTYGR